MPRLYPPNGALFSRLDTRWLRLIPNTLILLFVLTMGTAVWMLDEREARVRSGELMRDSQWAEQTLQLRLEDSLSLLYAFAQALPAGGGGMEAQIAELVANTPELALVARLGRDGEPEWGARSSDARLGFMREIDGARAWAELPEHDGAQFIGPFQDADGRWGIPILLPLREGGVFQGALVAVFDAEGFLRRLPPAWFAKKYQLSLIGGEDTEVAKSGERTLLSGAVARLALPGTGMRVEARPLRQPLTPLPSLQLLAIGGLALLTLVSLLSLSRHIRARTDAEHERNRIYRLSQEMLAVVRADMTIAELNPALCRLFGYDEARLLGTSLLSYLAPDAREAVRAELAQILAYTLNDRMVETVVTGRDGRQRWVLWAVSPLSGSQTLFLSGRDLTATRRAEQALRAESAYRKAMEDSLSVGVRAIDLDGRILHVNPAFCRITGYAAEELVGQLPPYPYWLPGEEGERCMRALSEAMAGGFAEEGYEQVYQRKGGALFYGHLLMSPLIGTDGVQTGWMAAMTDITEREEARRRLLAEHERFVAVFEGLGAAVAVVDADSAERYFSNVRYHELIGGVEGEHCCDLTLSRLQAGQSDDDYELCWPAEGGERWLSVRRRAIRWVNGRDARMVMVFDTTREHLASEEYAQQLQRMQAKSRLISMGEMASTLAHELNQPLSAIANYQRGCIERLRQGRTDPAALLPVLEKVAVQAERAGQIVHRARDFVKQSAPVRSPHALADLVDATLALAEIEARRQSARVEVRLPTGLPPVEVDAVLIEQVLFNLIRNGFDAMRALPAQQRVVVVSATAGARQVELTVADQGPGVPEPLRASLFDAFFTTKPDGMGMGLNICRTIVEQHRGHLWLGQADAGAVFHLTLPIAETICPSPP